jgi:glycosyltransferase involved in cell wall biosynthesis
MADAPILFDTSRLIWRLWTRRLPTGIDRVCLAYLRHFRGRSRAVVQFRQFHIVLDQMGSDRLFDLLLDGTDRFRSRLMKILAINSLRRKAGTPGQIYLNVGHTGLNSTHLGPWLAAQGLRPAYLIHDLIPITHPHYCRDGEAERHARRIENSLRSAHGLIVNSHATKDDLAHFAGQRGIPLPHLLVAWLGIDVGTTAARPAPAPGGARPYFVLLGTIEARKNHLTMLRVWSDLVADLGDKAPDLIIIGQRGWEAEEAIAILDDPGPLEDHIVELPRCDDEQLSQLLLGARAVLMPSFVEGYGLPLVEALGQGVPVIASDLPVFREISGEIPTYLDPFDRQAWTRAVLDYSDDGPERRRQMAALGSFSTPNWSKHFERVEEFLNGL